jgi:nitrite reductase/ring-hydroxylating ferredoxin subunit
LTTPRFIRFVRRDRLRDGLRRVRRARGLRLVLVHEEGRSWIVEDRCPHMGARLARGHYDEGLLWCPKHGFCFRLDTGARVSPEDVPEDQGLRCFPVEERDGWIGTELA